MNLKKYRKTVLLFALVFFVQMFGGVSVYAQSVPETNVSWTNGAVINGLTISVPTVITVSGVVSISAPIKISSDVTIKGGGTLKRTQSSGNLIEVETGGNLTLENITIDGNNTSFSGDYVSAIYVNGNVTMKDGTILKNHKKDSSSGRGAAVYVASGSFKMTGGEISGCETRNYGGAIYVYSGAEFTMSGGTIKNNKTTFSSATYGGGAIYVRGTLKISGGTIEGNSSNYGGAIYNSSYGTTEITGGTIKNNTAIGSDTKGSAIFHSCREESTSILKIGGNADIQTNNDIYLMSDTSVDKFIEITSSIKNNLSLTVENVDENRTIAVAGSGVTLTYNDMAKINVKNSNYFLKLDNNKIVITKTSGVTTKYPVYLGYDANGGSNAPNGDSKEIEVGQKATFTISSDEPARQNYDFLGWAKDPNATDPEYTSGSIEIDTNTVLYAVWRAVPQQNNEFTRALSMSNWTYGGTPSVPTAIAKYGDVKFVYSTSQTGSYGTEAPREAGVYWVKAKVEATSTYKGLESEPFRYEIFKATAPTPNPVTVTHKYSVTGEQSKQLGNIMPSGAGTLGYTPGSPSVSGSATVSNFSVDNLGLVKYTITGGAENDVITLPITISSANYENAVVNVVVTLTAKNNQTELTLSGDENVAFGQTLTFTASGGSTSGSVTYSVVNVTGEATIDSATGVMTPVKVGTVKVKAKKSGDAEYNDVTSDEKVVTITQAASTGEPKYTKITSANKTLADVGLTVIDSTLSPNAGTLEWLDSDDNVLPGTTVVTKNTQYKWRFTPSDTNYSALTGYIKPYIASTSSGSKTTRYAVSFETNGGTKITSQSVIKNTAIKKPAEPTKENFVFDGWYKDENLTEKYDFSDNVTKSFTLYAKWTKKQEEPSKPDDSEKPVVPETSKWENPFIDVFENDWFYNSVKYVAQNKIFSGTSANTFEPNMSMTREMLVTVLYRTEGEPKVNKNIPFEDVLTTDYFANAVIWAEENGIITGISETKFAPKENVTREQFAAMMFRYAKYKGYDVSVGENTNILSYDDSFEISEYAFLPMQYAVGSGLINGKTETTLNPKDSITRAEVATILQRFNENNK